MSKIGSFLLATLLGGVVFMFPIVIVGTLFVKTYEILKGASGVVTMLLPDLTVAGIALVDLLIVVAMLGICFSAGMVAEHRFAHFLRDTVENKIALVFPRYTILKAQLAGNIGNDLAQAQLKPVAVRFDDQTQIAFEVERPNDDMVTVYIPGAPDAWGGGVVHVAPERVHPLDTDIRDVVRAMNRMGRESRSIVKDLPKPA
ncbi:MAG: hypothetical protein VCD00_00615 [Candidatus Hydrogenedentota bacterium]